MQRDIRTQVDLRTRFRDVYEDFFSNNEIVVSTNLGFIINDDVTSDDHAMRISKNLPMRMYLGINKRGASVKIGRFLQFDKCNDVFIEGQDLLNDEGEIIEYLYKTFGNIGLEINMLVETAEGRSICLACPLAVLLASAVRLIKYDESLDGMLDRENVYTSAEKIVKYLNHCRDAKCCLRSAVSPNKGMALDMNTAVNNKTKNSRLMLGSHCAKVQKDFPLDMALVFSGITEERGCVSKELTRYTKKYLEIFKNLADTMQCSRESLADKYANMLELSNANLLTAISSLYDDGYSEESAQQFIQGINQIRRTMQILTEPVPAISNFITGMNERYYTRKRSMPFGAKYFSLGKMGGSILFVFPHKDMRRDMIEMMVNSWSGYGYCLEYASWEMQGKQDYGLRIDQNLESGLYSEFLTNNSIKIVNISGEDCRTIFSNSQQEALRDVSADILLDKVNGRVYVAGEKLTSKDIHSQSTAVIALARAIESESKIGLSRELPRSSYSTNKYEFSGKLFRPLKKLFEARTKKEFPFQISGRREEFAIEYLPTNNARVSVLTGSF